MRLNRDRHTRLPSRQRDRELAWQHQHGRTAGGESHVAGPSDVRHAGGPFHFHALFVRRAFARRRLPVHPGDKIGPPGPDGGGARVDLKY